MTVERFQARRSEGVGMEFPDRKADCSGRRPSWFPFQINVCDEDAPDPDMFPTERHLRLPDAPGPPDWLY